MTWQTTNIGTVIRSSQYGLSLPADPNGDMPIVGMKDIQGGRVRIDPDVRISLAEQEAEAYLLKDGDILLNRRNSPDLVGKAGIYRGAGRAVFASYLVRLELDRKQIDPDYVIQILASEGGQRHIRKLATRAVSQANLNPTTFKNHFQIPLPSLKEQIAVRDVLLAWDTAIQKTEQLIAAKERHYSHELSRLISRGQHPHGHVGAFAEEVSTIARLDVWEDGVLSPMYVVFRLDETKVDSDYFPHWLNSHEARQRIKNSAQGSVRETVSFSEFAALTIPLPAKGKQTAITHYLNALREEIDLLGQSVAALNTQKRGLMQKLLTGQWRLGQLNEVPA